MNRADFLKTLLGISLYAAIPKSIVHAIEVQNGETILNPHFVSSGNGFGNRIALTFDDGPTPGVTDVVLKELDRHNLRATFFMIGKKAEANPSLAKEVADAGHEVANHSYTHAWLTRLSEKGVREELQRAQDAIAKATGKTPAWFRPPYGALDKEKQGHIPLELGLGIAYWSVDPQDWAQPGADVIVSRVLNKTNPGSIILLHDLHHQTAQAAPDLMEGLNQKAFAASNLTRFLGQPY